MSVDLYEQGLWPESEDAPIPLVQDPNYPPPGIRAAVIAEKPGTADAYWPTPEQIEFAGREICRRIKRLTGEVPVAEYFDKVIVLTNGGYMPALPVIRTFNFDKTQVIHLPVGSYKGNGTERSDQVTILENLEGLDLKGKKTLTLDEVWDSGNTLVEVDRFLLEEKEVEENIVCVMHYKHEPNQHKPRKPHIYAHETKQWIVYPTEINEILGEKALDETLWMSEEARAALQRHLERRK